MWSPQQARALREIKRWLRSRDKPVFRLFGYAGTGKTEIAIEVGREVGLVRFAAFTGKAAHVLRQRGAEPVSTIHKLIYHWQYDEDLDRWDSELQSKDEFAGVKLLIIDEASMVDDTLARDLLSFGIPILVCADPEQLPPPHGYGWFMDGEPDVMLTDIQRHARDNPILHLADRIRRGDPLKSRLSGG
jgi:exodeoxyribonuclease-5